MAMDGLICVVLNTINKLIVMDDAGKAATSLFYYPPFFLVSCVYSKVRAKKMIL